MDKKKKYELLNEVTYEDADLLKLLNQAIELARRLEKMTQSGSLIEKKLKKVRGEMGRKMHYDLSNVESNVFHSRMSLEDMRDILND